MKYNERLIPKTVSDLAGQIKVAILSLPSRKFMTTILSDESSYDFDGTFYSLQQGVENLRKKFGDAKANEILEMLAQSKAHHETGWASNGEKYAPKGPGWRDVCLGNYLLQDVEMVVRDRQPWAYPKELYRWPINPWHPELSEADLQKKDFDEDYE
jgi:hypothetical protein